MRSTPWRGTRVPFLLKPGLTQPEKEWEQSVVPGYWASPGEDLGLRTLTHTLCAQGHDWRGHLAVLRQSQSPGALITPSNRLAGLSRQPRPLGQWRWTRAHRQSRCRCVQELRTMIPKLRWDAVPSTTSPVLEVVVVTFTSTFPLAHRFQDAEWHVQGHTASE